MSEAPNGQQHSSIRKSDGAPWIPMTLMMQTAVHLQHHEKVSLPQVWSDSLLVWANNGATANDPALARSRPAQPPGR